MKTLTLLTVFLILTACSSDPEKRAKFGDNKYHLFIENSTGDKYFIKHRMGDNYSLYKCDQVLDEKKCREN